MMGLLDGGVAAAFSGAFSSFYLDATVHRPTITEDGEGGGSIHYADEPVKAQLDAATEAMRSSDGYTDKDVRILVLAHGLAEIDSDCQITLKGVRYSIANPSQDPAGAYWELRGRPA